MKELQGYLQTDDLEARGGYKQMKAQQKIRKEGRPTLEHRFSGLLLALSHDRCGRDFGGCLLLGDEFTCFSGL
jgi:hypothetical protein